MIAEIDIWRAANMVLKHFGDTAPAESAARAAKLAAAGDHEGAAVWRRIARAVEKLTNRTPSGPVH